MEIKDVLEFFGADTEKIKSIEDFKKHFSESGFVKKNEVIKDPEIANTITGKRMGSIETILKRNAKELSIELEKEEIDGKSIEDIIPLFTKKVKDIIHEKEEAIKGGSDVLKNYEEKLNRYKSDANQYKEIVEKTIKERDELVSNSQKELISYIKQSAKQSALSSIKFGDSVDDIKKKGFISILDEKYDIEIDDKRNVYPVDKATNKRIENPNKAGEFFNLEDLYNFEAEKNKLIKLISTNNVKSFEFKPASNNENGLARKVPASQRLKF